MTFQFPISAAASSLVGVALLIAACSRPGSTTGSSALKPIDQAALQTMVDTTAKELLIPGAVVLLRTPQGDFIAASGTTPYVIAALQESRRNGIVTGCITCNPGSPLGDAAEYPIEVVVGPEFVTGSTRMKSGTAQKLVLNMISTTVMIQIGRVEDNKMVNMKLSNDKLIDRGTKMVMDILRLTDYDKAKNLLLKYGSVKKAVEADKNMH